MALLHAMAALARSGCFRVVAAHLNHGIRGRKADADARFVRHLAMRLGVKFIGGEVDVPALARRRRVSLEMAAREARYAFFVRAAHRAGADSIVTAHTADDQAETLLLKLARGTGMRGLGGIAPVSCFEGVCVVRPLLGITRERIESYLGQHHQAWREDHTNRDTRFLRNRVRHEILPLLKRRLNPRVRESLVRTAEIIRTENEVIELLVHRWWARHGKGQWLACRPFQRLPLALRRRVLHRWLLEAGVPAEVVDFELIERLVALADGRAGSVGLDLPDHRCVVREYDTLRITRDATQHTGHYSKPVKIPGVTRVPRAGLRVEVLIQPGLLKPRPAGPGCLPAVASLGRVVRRGLVIRSWRAGDRIHPLGFKGSKKIQDILTDAKVPRAERAGIPVVTYGDEIVWLPGYRVAQGWEITDACAPALYISIRSDPIHR